MADEMLADIHERHMKLIQFAWLELTDQHHHLVEQIYHDLTRKNLQLAVLFEHTSLPDQQQSFTVMISASIKDLETDIEDFRNRMRNVARTHVNYGVLPYHCKFFRSVFIKNVQQIDPKWNDEREAAWMWFWQVIEESFRHEFSVQSPTGSQKIVLVTRCWAAVAENIEGFANRLYERFRETSLRTMMAKADQTLPFRFFSKLNHAIRCLDNRATFDDVMVRVAVAHRGYGVDLDGVIQFGDILIDELARWNEDEWDSARDEAWRWFWNQVVECFEKGLSDAKSVEMDEPRVFRMGRLIRGMSNA